MLYIHLIQKSWYMWSSGSTLARDEGHTQNQKFFKKFEIITICVNKLLTFVF